MEVLTVLFLLGIGAVILFPLFAQPKESVKPTSCLSRVKQLALASIMYAEDYDSRLPNRDHWMTAAYPYHKHREIEHCPDVLEKTNGNDLLYGYAFNSRLSNLEINRVEHHEKVALIYDSINLARNASDPTSSFPIPGRHKGLDNVGFLDGHARGFLNPPSPHDTAPKFPAQELRVRK